MGWINVHCDLSTASGLLPSRQSLDRGSASQGVRARDFSVLGRLAGRGGQEPCRWIAQAGSEPEEITLSGAEATVVLFALYDAIEAAGENALRSRLEDAARTIVEKLMPDLPDM